MKFLVFLIKAFITTFSWVDCIINTSLLSSPGDNSHYIEGKSRYIWMPDDKNVPHLVDLKENTTKLKLRSDGAAKKPENQYWLYTRLNPDKPEILVQNKSVFRNSSYLPKRSLKVVVHGWESNGLSEVNHMIKEAFLFVEDCNVIVVDWGVVAHECYLNCVANVPSIGQELGKFLIWLIDTVGGSWDKVHLVGHSLGAHVIGNAGRTANNKAARITGLDPAGPLWTNNSNSLRASDAQYVEVIHTDGYILGVMSPIGQVNFYPNGGINPQPGCWFSSCSHRQAYKLFAATIYFDYFVGKKCRTLAQAEKEACLGQHMNMGNNNPHKSGSGMYGLQTTDTWPYVRNETLLDTIMTILAKPFS